MMLWHHNTRVNSHQRWKQMHFHICFHLWCELTKKINVTEWQVSWNSCVMLPRYSNSWIRIASGCFRDYFLLNFGNLCNCAIFLIGTFLPKVFGSFSDFRNRNKYSKFFVFGRLCKCYKVVLFSNNFQIGLVTSWFTT